MLVLLPNSVKIVLHVKSLNVLESQLSTLKPIRTDTVAIMSYTIEYLVEV